MSQYKEYKNLNYADLAEHILTYWKENNIFQQSIDTRSGQPAFTFYEGPPSANGTPGIHHVMARTVKDIFCRFKTLKGFQVKRKGGWDTHGLPVELQVEKELGITKEDIGTKISVEDYNQKCREAVMKFKGEWDDLTVKMGYWVDLNDPYVTFERDYMETLWHLLKKFYDKGLLYKGYTVQPYSPAAGTGLSSHELNQPGTYRDVKDTSITAQFKVINNEQSAFLFDAPEEDVRILAWTTTPWTLPSNCALAIGEKIDYVKVKTFNPYTFQPVSVVLAKELVKKHFSEKAADIPLESYTAGDKLIPFEVEHTFKGSKLVEVRYEQLMDYVTSEALKANAFRVIPGDFVTTEDGTGIVHTASVFGADDFIVAQKNNVPAVLVTNDEGKQVPLVDKQGRFVSEVTDFAKKYVKEEYYSAEEREAAGFKPTDVLIAIKLKEDNKAFKVEKYEHSYPHCWRTDKPVLYYPLDSWFIKTTAMKDRLVELNKTINWKPASTGEGRFGNWLENLVDWNLSRSRYWGTPLPIWVTEDRKEQKCIGSLEELKSEVSKSVAAGFMKAELADDFDLHRPYVDDVFLVSDSGQKMTREPDLIDVWFDSGAMPYAQWHYPFENEEVFNENYPADFIAEGVDQTRGWFFTLHAIAVMLFDKVAYKNVIANGLVLDSEGNKMSKRLGNAIDPFKTINKYGPDATRWYMISNANPWDNLKFNVDGVAEVQRKFFGTLQNTYNFFALYANLDGFTFEDDYIPMQRRTESDRWALSKLNSLVGAVDNAYEQYEPTRAARLIQDYVSGDLSNWYVRLNRKRFWKGEYNEDKKAAYQTLYECLEKIAIISAPIAPFYMDQLFQDLNKVSNRSAKASVHLVNFPDVKNQLIDASLEERMYLSQHISSLTHSIRKAQKIKVRQPLSKILIPVLNDHLKEQVQAVEDLILSEVNVKAVEYIDDASGVLVKTVKPNFRKLGQQFGPKMKAVSAIINGWGQPEIAKIESDGSLLIDLEGEQISLSKADVEITSSDIPGWSVATEAGITVALDITIDDALKKEGLARDLVNRIQNLRKEQGLDVQDKISIQVEESEKWVNEAINQNKSYICAETQALSLAIKPDLAESIELVIDDLSLHIYISTVK